MLTQLITRMEKASAALEFEEAARIRDQIRAVRRVTEKQFVSNTGDDLDVIGVAFDAGLACVHVLFIRQGKVLGSRSYSRRCRAALSWVKWWRLCRPVLFAGQPDAYAALGDPSGLHARR